MSEYNPVKAGVWYTICNILIKGIPFLTLPLFTKILSTEDFGLYNTYLSYEGILSIFISLGISGTIRTAIVEYGKNYDKYVAALILLQLILYIGVAIIGLGLSHIFNVKSWLSPFLIIILISHSAATSIFNILSGAYAISGKVFENIVISLLTTVFNITFSLLFINIFFTFDRYIGRILGTALAMILVSSVNSVIYCYKARIVKIKLVTSWNFAFKLGIPLLPHMLSMVILSQCDKIMIQSMVGNSEAGIYSLGVTIVSIVIVVISSIDNAWAPWFYRNLAQAKYTIIRAYNDCLSILFLLFCLLIVFLLPDIIRIMSSSGYWNSIYSALPLVVSAFITFMYLFAVNTEYYYKKSLFISMSTFISVLVNIILNYIFICTFGYIGAAYATCIAKFILYILHTNKSIKLSKDKVVSNRLLFTELITLIICSIGSGYYTNKPITRYLLMLCSCVFVIIYYYIHHQRKVKL